MKRIFTLAAAVLASFSLWAATESNPTADVSSNDDVVGISYIIPGNYVAGLGGTKAGDMQTKGIKFRLNRAVGETANAVEFQVNEGYVISQIDFCGHVNDNSKTSTITDVKVDGTSINFTPVNLPVKSSSTSFSISGIQATESIVMVFSGDGTQANIEYTVTYEEGSAKQVVSTTEELINAKVNGVALEEEKLNDLKHGYLAMLNDDFITAPEVTFVKRVEITYDDQSTKVDTVDVDVTAIESLEYSGMWQASITLGETTYSVIAGIAEAYTVTYKMIDGDEEIVLGTELVAVGEHPAEYAQYEVRPLCSFNSWRDGVDYIEEVDITQVVVTSDMSFYADFDKAYAQSIDFEQMVLNQGKSYDVKSALTAAFYDYKTIDALDSLNNSKGAARNEPYLGLKIKKKGGYLACNVLPGTTIRIKFGYVAETVLAIAGNDTMRLAPTNNKIADMVFPIQVETTVKLQTTSDKTVVIKQIMIDDPIATWMYPITYTAGEHGTVSGWTIAFPNEEVELSLAPEEGYLTTSLTYNGTALHDEVEGQPITFTMPAEPVNVVAVFDTSFPTAIDQTEAAVKAVKVLRNGQLLIEKNGILYNAQGTIVK